VHLRPLPAEESAVRRAIEELWLPYNRDLAAVVEGHALDEDADYVEEELSFRMDRLEEEDTYEVSVAVDVPEGGPVSDVSESDGDLAGFVATSVDEAPTVFDQPDRLLVCDIYVNASYRGGDLARTLMDRVAERADAEGCEEVVLAVDVDNERALAFYEKLGFEPYRHKMAVDADAF
jgi:ribosomal protein S18 acetylase RimI-like enzyme